MKIQSSNTKTIYTFEPGNREEERHLCPECSHTRKKKSDKCMAWDNKGKRGYCHNCETSFFEYSPYEPKQYNYPEWKNLTKLTDKAVKYFEGRMISQKTLNKMRVYSDNEFMPQFVSVMEVMCFPYFYNDKLINIKYRGAKKSFKLVSGAELILWNIDCIKDNEEIIITEGEIDALTFVENGFDNTISVPNGANKNLEYLDSYMELFNNVKKIYIASDQDTKGVELKDELIRRFGAERCYIVSFKDCKDANEYFLKYGDILKDTIPEAKAVPIKGIVKADNIINDIRNLYENGVERGLGIGDSNIDDYITWELGRLAIVTGIPSSGKSEFVDHIICRLNILYGWKCAYFTPENYPLKFHYRKLFEKIIGKKFNQLESTEVEYDMAYEYIKENFTYILDDDDFTVKSVIDSAKILVKNKGIKILVIDPYNKLDHKYTDSETQYISRFLDQLISFAKLNNILVFLVAHPRKMSRTNGKIEVPSLYDISGSANFYNKTDYGITVHRKTNENNIMINEVDVYFQKIKYKHLGEQGIVNLKYNFLNGRFKNDGYDNSNWLIHGSPESHKLVPVNNLQFDNNEAPF